DALYTSYGAIAAHRFEDALHAEYRAEGELGAERIGELWVDAHERYFFGNGMTATPEFAAWWSFYPHFVVMPGYLYAYAFGFLLSLSVDGGYLREGDALVEPIFDVLRAGGSIAPSEFAERLGLSLDDPRLWDDALDVLDEMVREAEALA